MSALLKGSIDQTGPCLVSVLRDENFLAVPPAEHIAAFAALPLLSDAGGFQMVSSVIESSVIVTCDMRIALVR